MLKRGCYGGVCLLQNSFLAFKVTFVDGRHVPTGAIVQKIRMVVSTVDNFIATNAERSYKVAAVYTKAKVVKKILANKVCILSDPFNSI
jgi:hypothetical protein